MIVSHKNKFIFIKNEKVAGTAIEIALSKFCGENDIITSFSYNSPQGKLDEKLRKEWGGMTPRNYKKYGFKGHSYAKEIKYKINESIWNNYYKFAFVRNPWDAQVSRFFFTGKRKKIKLNKSNFKKTLKNNYYINNNFDRISIGGKVVMDDIFKYEELHNSLDMITNKLNLPESLKLPNAKSEFRNHNVHYSLYYDDEAKEIVRQDNKELIKKFGYEF